MRAAFLSLVLGAPPEEVEMTPLKKDLNHAITDRAVINFMECVMK